MTYIVGINQFDINTIIADTHVSWWRHNRKVKGENIGLKSGLFFPGCIYGISGSFAAARTFIISCKSHLTGRYTLPDFWERFLQFTNSYRFPITKDSYFQLLLSSRNHGTPKFYVLDSQKSVIDPTDTFTSLGSGKQILDPYLQHLISLNTDIINKFVTVEKKLPHFTFPYLYCLWLNERVQGMELSSLEQHHVGGVFHFLWQDIQRDHAQLPALYVLSGADPKRKVIYSWHYRVAYAQGALVVDNPITNAREIIMDTAARPNVGLIPNDKLKLDITREIDAQPFYYFCGFGFIDPEHRGEFGVAITTEGKYAVDKAGHISPHMLSLIKDKFSRDYKIAVGDPKTSPE